MNFVYQHRFNDDLSCKTVISQKLIKQGKSGAVKVFWEGKPTRAEMREYVNYCHSIWQEIADKFSKKIMQIYQVSEDGYEVWTYAPGQKP
jgi:hypothetical protein